MFVIIIVEQRQQSHFLNFCTDLLTVSKTFLQFSPVLLKTK